MKPLSALTLFEALIGLVAGSFVALFFAHFAHSALKNHAFQKTFAQSQEDFDTLRFQLTNHFRQAFAPSLLLTQTSASYQVLAIPYPLHLLPTDTPEQYEIFSNLPTNLDSSLNAYCIENGQFATATLQGLTLKAALGVCEWAYLLKSSPQLLRYDKSTQWLTISPTNFAHKVNDFEIIADTPNNTIWLRLCVGSQELSLFACAHDEHSPMCQRGLCGEWKVL